MPIDSTDTPPPPPPPPPPPDNSRQRPATESELANAPLSELGREWRKENVSNVSEGISIALDLGPPGVWHDAARTILETGPPLAYMRDVAIVQTDKAIGATLDAVDDAAEAVAENLDDLASENRDSARATMDSMGRSDQDAELKLFFKELETQNRAIDEANLRERYGPGK